MFNKIKKVFTVFAVLTLFVSSTPLNVLADVVSEPSSEQASSGTQSEVSKTTDSTTVSSDTAEISTTSSSTSETNESVGTSINANAPNSDSADKESEKTTSSEDIKEKNNASGLSRLLIEVANKYNVDAKKVFDLSKRSGDAKYYTTGLSDDEIRVLGLYIFGVYKSSSSDYAKIPNDKGEMIDIPFIYDGSRGRTSSTSFAMNYTLRHRTGATSSFNRIGRQYIDGKPAFCIDPQADFLDNRNYTQFVADNNSDWWNINAYMIFGDDSSDKNHGYLQLMIWEQLGWTVTGVGAPGSLAGFQAYKASVNEKINNFYKKASFNGQTVTVKLGERVTLTDTNNAIQDMSIYANTANVGVDWSGNSIIVYPKEQSNETGYVGFLKLPPIKGAALIWGDGSQRQKVATAGEMDPSPTSSFINVVVLKNGEGKLGKVDENGNPVPNAEFEVKNVTTGEKRTLTTNQNGEFNVEYPDGTVLEMRETRAPHGFYRDQQVKRVTIKANQTVNLSFTNIHQKGKLILTKGDVETGGTPQGNAVLDNAVYALYKADGTFVQNITFSGRTGVATNLDLGAYYLQEVKAPTGYALDTRRIDVNIPYAGQDVKISVTDKTVTDKVIKGSIKGWKFGNKNLIDKDVDVLNGNGNIKNPLQGVEITARSYTTGIEYKAVTDNNGYFEINNLPYDRYQLIESKGKEGYRLIMPFDFEIRTDGVVHQYLLEDKVIENKIKIVKIDADTGRTIPIAGVQFKIYDKVKGAYISMLKPNSDQKSEIFETNAEGYLLTSDTLLYGKDRYRLEEVQAPYRYTKGEPITFSVDSKGNAEILVVDYANEEQMGKVILNKTVEKPVGKSEAKRS